MQGQHADDDNGKSSDHPSDTSRVGPVDGGGGNAQRSATVTPIPGSIVKAIAKMILSSNHHQMQMEQTAEREIWTAYAPVVL